MNLASFGATAMTLAVAACLGTLILGIVQHRRTAIVLHLATISAGLAVGCLTIGLVGGAFELAYVADTTTRATPTLYRLSGLWGAMEGSLLFWSWLHLVVGSAAIVALRGSPLRGTVAATIASIAGTELLLGVVFSDPFVQLEIPAVNGNGLVAVLRHPAMVIHPPLLYLGLTATIVPFALLVASARHKHDLRMIVGLAKSWLRFSWIILTLGMLIGASWAYVEAGWGGFWAWDAVENTSLLPWLAITGALHATGKPIRTGSFVGFTILAFASTTMGVVLTRSGGSGSVHAFAEAVDTGRGLLALCVLTLLCGSMVAKMLIKGESRQIDPTSQAEIGRSDYLLLNNVVLAATWLVVAAGTFVPAIATLLGADGSATDPIFYVRYAAPIAIAGLVGLGLLFAGRRFTLNRAALGVAAPVCGIVAGLVLGSNPIVLATVVTAVFSLAAIAGSALSGRSMGVGLLTTHAGLALLLGASAASTLGERTQTNLAIGDSVTVSGQTFRLDDITTDETEEYLSIRVTLTGSESGSDSGSGSGSQVITELRRYHGQIRPSTEAALLSGARSDTMVILQDVDPSGTAVRLSILVKPLVMWVWVGGVMMVIGACLHVLGTRRSPGQGQSDGPQYQAAITEPQPARTTT